MGRPEPLRGGGLPLQWLRDVFAATRVATFDDIATPSGEGYRLRILLSDVLNGRLVLLPDDAEWLGLTTGSIELAWAVAASASTSEPIEHRNALTGKRHVLADGTLLSHFPVWLFDTPREPLLPTFGIRIVPSDRRAPMRPAAHGVMPETAVPTTLIPAAIALHERLALAEQDQARTIDIAADSFDDLREAGLTAAKAFLETWDFRAYVDRYRRGELAATSTATPVLGGSQQSDRVADLVLDGALPRTPAIQAAVEVLEASGYQPRYIAGASGGALVGALITAGYRSDEIREVVEDIPYRETYRDREWNLPRSGAPPIVTDEPMLENYDDKRIAAWIGETEEGQPLPLAPERLYTLRIRVGAPVRDSLIGGRTTVIPRAEVPLEGLDTKFTLSSESVEFEAGSPEVTVYRTADSLRTIYGAAFPLHVPRDGDSATVDVQIKPNASSTGRIEVTVDVAGDRYREFAIQLDIEEDVPVVARRVVATVVEEDIVTPAGHLGVRPPHEWQTPDAHLKIRVGRDRSAQVEGDVRQDDGFAYVEDEDTPWAVAISEVAGLIDNVRNSAEKFRGVHDGYLNGIDPHDLINRLGSFQPVYAWSNDLNFADADHLREWDQVRASAELQELAYDGHQLYRRIFPVDQPLRGYVDGLHPGDRLDISWTATADGVVPRVPWGLLYIADPTEPIDPLAFLGLRLRLSYRAYRTSTPASLALGNPRTVWLSHLLYWGGQHGDITAVEADWQRRTWAHDGRDVFVPQAGGPEAKAALLAALRRPHPVPTPVLYLYCRSEIGQGNEVTLQFGSTNALEDLVRRFDLPAAQLDDQPLVFANACSTSSSKPYYLNELERGFFDRGARAFIGTETRVPPVLASRFATVFFEFFTRKVDPEPIAAGEAFWQARHFLWSHYRNVGGLFYAYINKYDIYLADDVEVRAMRR